MKITNNNLIILLITIQFVKFSNGDIIKDVIKLNNPQKSLKMNIPKNFEFQAIEQIYNDQTKKLENNNQGTLKILADSKGNRVLIEFG